MLTLADEPLARHGFWRVGGPLERLVVVDNAIELASILPADHVLGNGSNLLIPDEGLRGLTVRLAGEFRDVRVVEESGDEVLVEAGAGLLNAVLLRRLEKLGLGGVGCLAGVPGTIGGAVAMNAGTTLGEIADCLVGVDVLPAGGGPIRSLPRSGLAMAYRVGGLPPEAIALSALLRTSRAGYAEEKARIAEHLARRKATQPLDLPSCGSVFRNPPGDHAGRLIESVGLRGWRCGNAEISSRHANFIVNLGGATSLEVMTCIRTAWDRVREATGVRLTPEVHVLGRWPPELWPFPA